MSELKVHKFDDFSLHDMVNCKFYIKSETDKVIAEPENRIDGDKGFNIAIDQNERLLKIVSYQKYKRCLAMAKWCDDVARLATCDTDYHRCGWYNKWMQRWLELAEKFKLNKDKK